MKKVDFNVSNKYEKYIVGVIERYNGQRLMFCCESDMVKEFNELWYSFGLSGVKSYKIFNNDKNPRHGLHYALLKSEADEFLADYTKMDYRYRYVENDNKKLDIKNLEDEYYEKLKEEYNKFLEDVKSRTKEELMNSGYEIVMKNEIIHILYYDMSISKEKMKTLLSHDYLLEELYLNLCYNDKLLYEKMKRNITDSLDSFISFHNKDTEREQ